MNKRNKEEDIFQDGIYAVPKEKKEPKVKIRALYDYCQSKGVRPDQLTEKELEIFLDRKSK